MHRSTYAGSRPLPVISGSLTEGPPVYRGKFKLEAEVFLQLLRVWSIKDRGFETLYRRFMENRQANSANFAEFWRQNPDLTHGLTDRQKGFTRCHDRVEELRSFEFDGVKFKPFRSRLKTDNSIVTVKYEDEDDGETVCYGRIKKIFKHYLKQGNPNELFDVFIECDWYSADGVDELTGLTRVVRNTHFDVERISSARQVLPISAGLVKVDPFARSCEEFYVLLQRDRKIDNLD